MANKEIKENWRLQGKIDYISDKDMSLENVANKYGVHLSAVKKEAVKSKWTEDKDKIWERAEQQAITEVEEGIEDLIKRHGKTARSLQFMGLEKLNEDRKNKKLKQSVAARLVTEGLKAERELYPKELKISGDIKSQHSLGDIPEELIDEFNEALERAIRGKSKSLNRNGKDKKPSNLGN